MDFNRTIITKSAEETKKLGADVANSVRRGEAPRIICLYGELGSGKTTFTQGFAQAIGLIRTRLLSPTFIIVRRYQLPYVKNFFYHIDLYRMEKEEGGLEALGLDEIFADSENYVVIEWPERLGGLLPKDRADIYFSTLDDGKHKIIIR